MRDRVIAYFLFSKGRPTAILDFHIIAIFVKNSNLQRYIFVIIQNLVKIGLSAFELLRFSIFKLAAVRHLGFGMKS